MKNNIIKFYKNFFFADTNNSIENTINPEQNLSKSCPFEPVVIVSVSMAFSIYLPIPRLFVLFTAIFLMAFALAFSCLYRKKNYLTGITFVLVSSGIILGMVIKLSSIEREKSISFGFPLSTINRIEGILIRDSAAIKDGSRYLLELDSCMNKSEGKTNARGMLTIILKPVGPCLKKGSRILVKGCFSLEKQGNGIISFNPELVILNKPKGILGIRSIVLGMIESVISRVGTVSTPLLKALLLGMREDLDTDIQEIFKRAGCAHILALSGQHLSVLASIMVLLASRTAGRFFALIISSVLIFIYTFLVGAEPSVLRGSIMFALVAIGRLSGRPVSPLNSLAISFFIQTIFFPETVYQWAFILSFLAMIGLIVLSPSFDFLLLPYIGKSLSSAFSASLGAVIATFPFCITAFKILYPGGILIATIAGPVAQLFLWAGFFSVISVSIFPILLKPVSFIMDIIWRCLIALLKTGANIPSISINNGLVFLVSSCIVVIIIGSVYSWPYVQYFRYKSD